MKKHILFILVFLFSSCLNEADLGENYHYLPSYEAFDIGYPYGSIIYKSDRKLVFKKILIHADIDKLVSNKQYILVTQKPNRQIALQQLYDRLYLWKDCCRNNPDSIYVFENGVIATSKLKKAIESDYENRVKVLTDSLFNVLPYYKQIFHNSVNYYIINKQEDIVSGPLNRSQFMIMKRKLKIHEDL